MKSGRMWARRLASPEGLVLSIVMLAAPLVYAVAGPRRLPPASTT